MSEALITYNNAIHSATKHTPFELFSGHTHIFNQTIKFNSEFREKLYPLATKKLSNGVVKRTLKLNETRTDPIDTQSDTLVVRKENRRNKMCNFVSSIFLSSISNLRFMLFLVSSGNQSACHV